MVLAADAFAEVVAWRLVKPVPPSSHQYRYRLAYVVAGQCVLRYDNERGKGDLRHRDQRERETTYAFVSVSRLLADFQSDIEELNHEHSRA